MGEGGGEEVGELETGSPNPALGGVDRDPELGRDLVIDEAAFLPQEQSSAVVVAELRAQGIRAEADLRNEKISYKVREHSVGKIPVQFAVGQRETESRSVAIRRLG